MPQFDDTFSTDRMAEIRRKEEESLVQALAAQYGFQYINLRGVSISPEALLIIPEETARDANIAAFEMVRKKLSVAIKNPHDPKTKAVIEDLTNKGYTITAMMTTEESLEHGWQRYKDLIETDEVKHGILEIDEKNIEKRAKEFKMPEDINKAVLEVRTLNSVRRISETLEIIFSGALALGASDIHIEPEENVVRLRYRLDGVLHDVTTLERFSYERVMSRLKLISGMMLNVKDEAQDGRFTFTVFEKQIEVRSSVIPGADGESIVMRLLDPTVASFNMEQLGINEILYKVLVDELKRPNGMIITTGPTGSGKTTALYAFLRETHTPEVKIITIENPVEYKVEGLVQTQVSEDYTFASGLRAVLRQDPDIIMVGEIRDREVAETAVHAAQTGHLVFSTLHTNSAVGAFPRLIDLGVDHRMIGTSVNMIIGQRLVRVLCEHCKKGRSVTADELELIKKVLYTHPKPPPMPDPLMLFEPVGCPKCNHTGYKGRQAVFEAIQVDQDVEAAVVRDPREHIILQAAQQQGIPTMAEDGIDKVVQGRTSLLELRRVVDLTDGRHMLKKDQLMQNQNQPDEEPEAASPQEFESLDIDTDNFLGGDGPENTVDEKIATTDKEANDLDAEFKKNIV